MAGRYPETPVAKHPAYDRGAQSFSENEDHHRARAKELRPKGMTAAERRCWDRIAVELSRLGRLKTHFVDFVQEYCVVKCRLDSLRADLDSRDWTYVTTGRHGRQLKSRPEVAQLNDDWRKWNSLVAQLGLSPATELRFNDRQGSLFGDDDFSQI